MKQTMIEKLIHPLDHVELPEWKMTIFYIVDFLMQMVRSRAIRSTNAFPLHDKREI
jgi:hypothetical protein